MSPIKVVVIDDNIKFRRIIREILSLEEDMEICDEADTLNQAKSMISQHSPDVAILDISVDEPDGGLKFLRESVNSKSSTNFIILSAHAEESYSARSLEAGAKGYVCKDKTVRCLANAIRSVCNGQKFVSADT